jgi:8-oxo-dGTP diphosphatase
MSQASTSEEPPIAAAIIVSGGRVLLVRRRVAEGELSWQFPAGKVEPGESAEEAAIREASEEAGVVVQAVRLLGERVHPETGRRIVYVICELLSGTAFPAAEDEVAEVAWCDREAVASYVSFPFHGRVGEYLDSVLA